MPFIPHTEAETRAMLTAIGVASLDELFQEIPAPLLQGVDPRIPPGMNEQEVTRLLRERAAQDGALLGFIGAGAYEHHIPAAVWQIATRGEFYTAYTPYQAEASQGTLQAIFEFQTMIAALTGMDAANASMYDGASAVAEAVLMAVRANSGAPRRVVIPATLHPAYRRVVATMVAPQGIELVELPYCTEEGRVMPEALKQFGAGSVAGLVIPQPNFFGVIEEVDGLTSWAHSRGALAIAVVNPVALGLLKAPGEWGDSGADIVCGEGQPLGAPLASGGPYFGFIACKNSYLRQIPGRIVGRTVDREGRPGFVLTLQTREQHIRRARATSNICTNQGLMSIAAAIHLALLGPQGLREVALTCHANTRELLRQLTALPGVSRVFTAPLFHEVVIRVPGKVDELLKGLAAAGIAGGYPLGADYPELGDALLVCATETKSPGDLTRYATVLRGLIDG